jgi:hypothetical protein
VLIVDDVMTAGTAVRESLELIRAQGAEPAGVLIALDRQERGQGERSAAQEVAADTAFRSSRSPASTMYWPMPGNGRNWPPNMRVCWPIASAMACSAETMSVSGLQ